MRRFSPKNNVVSFLEKVLIKIEEEQEHDSSKVEKSLKNLEKSGGVDLSLHDHFKLKSMGNSPYLESPPEKKVVSVNGNKVPLNAKMYVIGRLPNTNGELVYYEAQDSGINVKSCGKIADRYISRFDTVILPSGERIKLLDIGTNPKDIYFEGTVEF